MAGGFLGLAYAGEISIVFNLAYFELRNGRYLKKAKDTINILNDKFGSEIEIERQNSELYNKVKSLLAQTPQERFNAWSCLKEDGGIKRGIGIFVLVYAIYPFFEKGWDRSLAMCACSVSTALLIAFTCIDYVHSKIFFVHENHPNPIWWGIGLSILFLCLCYPPIIVYLGRVMMDKSNRVADHLLNQLKAIEKPEVIKSIQEELIKANFRED